MSGEHKKLLLKLARAAISSRFDHRPLEKPQEPVLQEKRGLFVSLHKQGQLRGCIGYIKAFRSIVDSVVEMAQEAAFSDPRFPSLRQEELDDLEIEISVLSEMMPVASTDEIVIGRDGLFIQHPHGSGLLLPQVPVEWNWDLPEYLKHICLKAGLHQKAWQDPGARLHRFTAEVFSEADFSD